MGAALPSITEIPVDAAEARDAVFVRVGVALIWLVTAAAVFHPWYRTIGEAYLVPLGLDGDIMWATCAFEAVLGLWVLLRRPGPWTTFVQIGMVTGFTVILIAVQPELLSHPLGVLSKNGPILASVFAAWALTRPAGKEAGRLALWLGVGLLWMYEGLVPKILFTSAIEIGWVDHIPFSPLPGWFFVPLVGVGEILMGLALLVPGVPLRARRVVLIAMAVLLFILPATVAPQSPEFLVHPFMPLAKNLPLLGATLALIRQSGRGLGPWPSPFFVAVPATGPSAFSRLTGHGGPVGAGFFAREGLVEAQQPAQGLLDDLGSLSSEGFDAAKVHPSIRGFYEETAAYTMRAQAEWAPGFGQVAPLFRRWFSARAAQFGLPLDGEPDVPLETTIVALRGDRDGRQEVRGWVRVNPTLTRARHPDEALTVYAAACAVTRRGGRPRLSVAFVLPFGNLTSVLEPSHLDGGGLRLSTCGPDPAAGLYAVEVDAAGAGRALALSFMHEQLELHGEDDRLTALHRIWLFGLPFLTMRYTMTRSAEAEPAEAAAR